MHQHNDRECKKEGIGGAHWGPVLAYMSKVEDAATADGSSEFFKVYQNAWKKNPAATQGDNDFRGTKDLNYNCKTYNCSGIISNYLQMNIGISFCSSNRDNN